MKCQQTHISGEICNQDAKYLMFWPGNEPLHICEVGKEQTNNIASAMGFHCHIEEITDAMLKEGEKADE